MGPESCTVQVGSISGPARLLGRVLSLARTYPSIGTPDNHQCGDLPQPVALSEDPRYEPLYSGHRFYLPTTIESIDGLELLC